METVTNAASTVATTASKLIFGETTTQQSGTEPKAGETGNANQPYDAGNIESGNPGQGATTTTSDPLSKDTTTTSSDPLSKDTTSSSLNPLSKDTTTTTTGAHNPSGLGNDTTGSSDLPIRSKDTSTSALDNPTGVNNPGASTGQKPTTSDNVGGFGAVDSSVSADPKSGQSPQQKQHGADRPNEKPTGDGLDAVKDTKDEGEAALAKRDPNDHSGEPMKMHGGDEKKDRSASVAGQEGGGEHGKEQGTGELHVKSSGLQAEGGDFDASKPGAGREADRLLEQKGIKRDDPSKGPPVPELSSSSKSPERADKASKLDKIKEKLHIGKKDKS